MTRETKIGLLVGLAFIIVIGILLSDHMASTTDPPQARLDKSADSVRSSIATPNSGEPPITVVSVGSGSTPSQPIPTQRELAAQRTPALATTTPATKEAGMTIAQSDAPETQKPPIVIRESRPPAAGPSHEPTRIEEVSDVTPEGSSDPLEDWVKEAKRKGVEIVPVKRGSTPTAKADGARTTEYKAESGDNLSKLAIKLLGANTKANRDAIVAANPSLRNNPDRIIVGRKYQIPVPAGEAAEEPAGRSASTAKPVTPEKPPTEDRPTAGPSIYVVKENDTLWKIAARELGSGVAWTQIKELNQDVLKGGDQVVANMKLRMPAKPASSAAAN